MKNKLKIIIVVLVVVLIAVVVLINKEEVSEPDLTACTEEALLCPDGSGVGRSGPQCQFDPCPNQESFIGQLQQTGAEFSLLITAPDTSVQEVTYSLPLKFSWISNVLADLVDKQVQVKGTFRTGNVLEVETAELVQTNGLTGELKVGETKVINGLRLTLNEITEDSRCPADVTCIQAGRVVAKVTLKSDTDEETLSLATDETPKPFDTFQISIDQVAPNAMSNFTLNQADYRLTFKVENL